MSTAHPQPSFPSWLPIIDFEFEIGQSVLLAGGYIDEHEFDFEFHDERPREMATLPVRATWLKDYPSDEGYWCVIAYDAGVCTIDYHKPTHWMPLPKFEKPT